MAWRLCLDSNALADLLQRFAVANGPAKVLGIADASPRPTPYLDHFVA